MQLLHIAPGQMWWLITCAGLTGSWGAQTLGQTLLMMMMMSVRVFVDETDIWIGRLSEADCLQPCGWASSNQLKPWIEQNAEPPAWEKKPSSCLPLSWGIRVFFFFFCPYVQTLTGTIGLLGSSCWYSDWNHTISSPEFPACWLKILGLVSLHNHVSFFLIINLFIYTPLICSVSREPGLDTLGVFMKWQLQDHFTVINELGP